jgi:hypothetical protein
VRLEPYTPACSELLRRLAELDGQPLDAAREQLRGDVDALRSTVEAELAAWAREGMHGRDLLCHETGTHFKWFLGTTAERVLWLHQYKPTDARSATYAETIHDHRYSFVSVVLAGGYDHVHYEIRPDGPVAVRTEQYRAPDDYVLDADAPHRVTGLLDGTLTVILQGPARKDHSTVFHPDGRRTRHSAYDARLPALLDSLGDA